MKSCVMSLCCGLLLLSFGVAKAAAPMSATGYWQTVDDKTGKVLSVVKIYKAEDGTLAGNVNKILPVFGQSPKDVCKECDGPLQNKPILGMRIIWNMQADDATTWVGGRVLDPKSGKVYRGRMTITDNGCKLNLRGYIGLPIIGRTETWLRTETKACK
jgi:uncharacterized protein (DUF2147 family)